MCIWNTLPISQEYKPRALSRPDMQRSQPLKHLSSGVCWPKYDWRKEQTNIMSDIARKEQTNIMADIMIKEQKNVVTDIM